VEMIQKSSHHRPKLHVYRLCRLCLCGNDTEIISSSPKTACLRRRRLRF